jgi:hypothetical protein
LHNFFLNEKVNKMKTFKITTFIFLLSLIMSTASLAQDVTLSWDESPSSSVTGYYVHYQMGDDTSPFTGTGADQGDSPIDVGDTLSVNLTGLTDGAAYYFAVTAYDDADNVSVYSNIVSSAVSIELLYPSNYTTDEPLTTSFEWEALDSSYDVYYKLVYGTDETEVSEAEQIQVFPPTTTGPGTGIWLFIATCCILVFNSRKTLSVTARWGALALFSISLLSACGSGGDGSSSSTSSAVSTTSSEDSVLTIVDTGFDDFYDVTNLNAATTYYWKVIATDNNDATVFYESDVYQFTTADE